MWASKRSRRTIIWVLLALTACGQSTVSFDVDMAPNYDPDAEALFEQIENVEGITLSQNEKLHADNFIKAIKAQGWWNRFLGLYLVLGNVEASQKYNARDPRNLDEAYRLTPFVEGTGFHSHSSAGWQATGIDDSNGATIYTHIGTDDIAPIGETYAYGNFLYNTLDITSEPRGELLSAIWNGEGSEMLQVSWYDNDGQGILRFGNNNPIFSNPTMDGVGFYSAFTENTTTAKAMFNNLLLGTEVGTINVSGAEIKGIPFFGLHNGVFPPESGSDFYGPSHSTGRLGFAAISNSHWTQEEAADFYNLVNVYTTGMGR